MNFAEAYTIQRGQLWCDDGARRFLSGHKLMSKYLGCCKRRRRLNVEAETKKTFAADLKGVVAVGISCEAKKPRNINGHETYFVVQLSQ